MQRANEKTAHVSRGDMKQRMLVQMDMRARGHAQMSAGLKASSLREPIPIRPQLYVES